MQKSQHRVKLIPIRKRERGREGKQVTIKETSELLSDSEKVHLCSVCLLNWKLLPVNKVSRGRGREEKGHLTKGDVF